MRRGVLATRGRPIETDERFNRQSVRRLVRVPDHDADLRPDVAARFLEVGGEKQYVRGVTYGTFADGADGSPYPDPHVVSGDFAAMAAAGVNSVRLYTAPPRWLLDLAHEHGLTVMVGLAWEQHVAFLDDRTSAKRIVARGRARRRDVRRPSRDSLLRGRQRDLGLDRQVARQPQDRALHRAALFDGERCRPRSARHLRQLPLDRVPAAALSRPRLLQRLPGVRSSRSRHTSRASTTSPATGRC